MRLIATFALMAVMAAAQEAKPAEEVRIFQLKYADPEQVNKVLELFRYNTRWDRNLKAVTVSAPSHIIAAMEEAVKKLDVPPPPVRNIELTVYILAGSDQPSPGSLPPAMEPVVKQLSATFGLKGYRLVDTQVIRAREGQSGDASSVVETNPSGQKTVSQFRFNRATITSDEKGRVIRLDGLKLGLKTPVPASGGAYQYIDTGISTDIDVREGQKVVVGKAASEGADKASFLVVMARVLE